MQLWIKVAATTFGRNEYFWITKEEVGLASKDESDSHPHDCVNFTIPKLGQSMSPSECHQQLKVFSEPYTPIVKNVAFM